jgi:hypothetical protein
MSLAMITEAESFALLTSGRDGALGVPAGLKPASDTPLAESSSTNPLIQVSGLSKSRESHGVAPVGTLLPPRRPAAVLWRIWSVVVDALNGVTCRWAWPHVLKERRKAVSPAVADGDAAPAVASERLVARGMAALAHMTPRCVLGRAPPVGRVPMSGLQCPSQLALETAARLRGPVLEILAIAIRRASAVASAEPFRASLDWNAFNNDKTTESLSGKINPWATHNSPLGYGCSISNWSVQRQSLWVTP